MADDNFFVQDLRGGVSKPKKDGIEENIKIDELDNFFVGSSLSADKLFEKYNKENSKKTQMKENAGNESHVNGDKKVPYKLYSDNKYNGKKITLFIRAGFVFVAAGTIVIGTNFANSIGLNKNIGENVNNVISNVRVISDDSSDLEEYQVSNENKEQSVMSLDNGKVGDYVASSDDDQVSESFESSDDDQVSTSSELSDVKESNNIDHSSQVESDGDQVLSIEEISNKSSISYGEYDNLIEKFNSFVDGNTYQIGQTSEVNQAVKNFLYNTEAGYYIQYYSNKFGVDPKMAVAVAAGESSLLHEMNDGAATGLFGLEKGIKDQFWVYDYDEQKNVLIEINPDECFDIKTNIRNGIAILAYMYSFDGNIYDSLYSYNLGKYGFDCMLDENYYSVKGISDRGCRNFTDYYCSKYKMGTPNYIDNIGKCLFEDTFTMKCRDVEITQKFSTGEVISIKKLPIYNYDEGDSFDEIIAKYGLNYKTL